MSFVIRRSTGRLDEEATLERSDAVEEDEHRVEVAFCPIDAAVCFWDSRSKTDLVLSVVMTEMDDGY